MSDSILEHMNASRPLLSKFEHISQLKSVEGISLENDLKMLLILTNSVNFFLSSTELAPVGNWSIV
jgi:hypothetical protein